MRKSLVFVLAGFFLVLASCKDKDKELVEMGGLNGTWISEDKSDTLNIINNHTFEKPSGTFAHTFDYNLGTDSITIRYKGPNKILVQPTNHKFTLQDNQLTIDFTKGCYGFESKKITYNKN